MSTVKFTNSAYDLPPKDCRLDSSGPAESSFRPNSSLDFSESGFFYSIISNATDAHPRRVGSDWMTFVMGLADPDVRGEMALSEYLQAMKEAEEQALQDLPADADTKQRKEAVRLAQKPIKDAWKGQKDGAAWIPALFGRQPNEKGNLRHSGNVLALFAVVLDFDEHISRARIEDKLNGYRYIAHTSYTHHPTAEKWRVIIPLVKPVPGAYAYVLYDYFNSLFGGSLDTRCRNPDHLYYLPSCPPDATEFYQQFSTEGELFDPSFLEEQAHPKKVSASPPPNELTEVNVDRLLISHRLRELIKTGQGNYDSRSEAVFAVVQGLIRVGLEDGQIAAVLLNPEYNISEKPLEKGVKWVMEEIARGRAKAQDGQQQTTSSAQSQSNSRDKYHGDTPLTPFPLIDILQAQQWMHAFLETKPSPSPYLLQDVLVLGKPGGLVAPGGSGKSQLELQMGISVATGLALFGRWPVAKPGAALLLFAEEDLDDIHRRLHHTISYIEETTRIERELLAKRLILASVMGERVALTGMDRSGNMVRTANVARLLASAKAIPELRLIAIDPLSAFYGGDENNSAHMACFIETLNYLSRETGATTFVCHHTTKASQTSGLGDTAGAARGSSAFTNSIRWQANLTSMTKREAEDHGIDEKDAPYYLKLTVSKTNYTAPVPPLWLRRARYGYLEAVVLRHAKEQQIEAQVYQLRDALQHAWKEGREYSRHKVETELTRQLGIGEKRMREVIQTGLEKSLLKLVPPRTKQHRNVKDVVWVP